MTRRWLCLTLAAAACGGGAGDATPAPDAAPDAAPPPTHDAGADAEPDAPLAGGCTLPPEDADPDSVEHLGCEADYLAVAAPPLVANLPGALSAKTVIDRADAAQLYFQNSRRYPIHWDFASAHLSGQGLPLVPPLGQFNQTEYYTPDRRFLLGALSHYEGPDVWAYEIAPYDTADAAMIEAAWRNIRGHLWVGERLVFHPTSDNVARVAEDLPPEVPVVTTEILYEGITYQPLNLATALGQLRFFTADELDDHALSFRDIAVLQAAPNDLSVCLGTITETFQTPLSHINVLAQNRGTPNMGLRGAFDDPALRALEGRWVELTVGAQAWSVREVSREEADAWWEGHRPARVVIPAADLSVTGLHDVDTILDVEGLGLRGALLKSIPAFGGKASHFGAFRNIPQVPYPPAVVVPVHYYDRFMEENGFYSRLEALLAQPEFNDDAQVRAEALQRLQDDIEDAPLDPAFEALLDARLATDLPGVRVKVRSSTNCEDLNGFTGAGLYDSKAAEPDRPGDYGRALRHIWASVWRPRTFDERTYRGIPHRDVKMAALIHRSFPDEDAQGVGITANIFDPLGIEPGQYLNVQKGDVSVVRPPDGVTSDQFVYHADLPGQPIVYLEHSSLVPPGETVLTRAQVEEVSGALRAIHAYFEPVYGPNTAEHFYAMDVEFKFDQGLLVVKQARPYPGRGR